MEPADTVPIARRKLQQVLAAEDLVPGSHDYKVAVALVENFPLDELLSASTDTLRTTVGQLLELQEQRKVRLFAHRDIFDRSVSLLVALPRDRFNAELRHRLQDLFMERFNGTSVDYHLALGETDPAQIHFRIHVADGKIPDVSFAELENEVVALARTWDDRLLERLAAAHGEERGRTLWARWEGRFPEYYKSSTEVTRAVLDIEHLERLRELGGLVVALHNEHGAGELLTRLLLYKTGGRAELSAVMPMLEALGLSVVEEVPVRVAGPADDPDAEIFIHDYGVLGPGGEPLAVASVADRVSDAVSAVWHGETDSDRLDRLVLIAGLTWREVAWLRAMRTYLLRVSAGFTLDYQNDAFAANPSIAADLAAYFRLRHDPATPRDEPAEEALRDKILASLDAVPSLDHDRILRSYLHLIDAIVRTNAFRPGRSFLSFKIRSAGVPDMPKPYPLFEIFVHSAAMEGIHLRAGRVARGGIRWSDRMEDYRTEILGLMKTQTTKNAVIVPTGSKGGFVVRRSVPPERLRDEVREQYVTLVRGLLDVTDDLVGGEVRHPEDVRVLDDPDPYLVVAADKGTATFFDTANAVSEEVGFWLGDAFASGGSTGYDQRRAGGLGVGRRHFRELGRDALVEPFTAVGIGDAWGRLRKRILQRATTFVAGLRHQHLRRPARPAPVRRRPASRCRLDLDDFSRSWVRPAGAWPRARASTSPRGHTYHADGPERMRTPSELVVHHDLSAAFHLTSLDAVGRRRRPARGTRRPAGERGRPPPSG